MKRIIYIILGVLLPWMAQATVVTGRVTDQTGEGVIAASVVVKGTSIGTVTDYDGYYSLDVPEDAILVFSYIGMTTQEIVVSGESSVVNIQLSEDTKVLDEVVVTGYGTTKKRDLVTSVASVSGEQLKNTPVVSVAEALQGKLSGVQVTTAEGAPDAEVKIRVRGGTSLTQSSEPLYIVDGFPVNSIADIPPGDIESIDVLKDAAATAIYGAKGANGVIMITTKGEGLKSGDSKAESGKIDVHADYTGYMGWRSLAYHYDMMNSEDYLRMQYEFLYLSEKGNAEKMSSRFFSPYSTYDPSQGRYEHTPNIAGWDKQTWKGTGLQSLVDFWNDKGTVDWQNEIYGGNHLNSNHTVGFNLGNKLFSLNMSYNRVDDRSIMYGSDYNRNNASLKLKIKPIKDLNIGINARYTNTNVLGSGSNSADEAKNTKSDNRLRNAVSFLPLYGIPVKLTANETLEDDAETNIWNLFNPYTAIDDNYKTKVEHKWNVNAFIAYKFLNHFTVRVEAGYEGGSLAQKRYNGATTSYAKNGDGKSQAVAPDGSPLGHVIVTNAAASRFKETNTFEYAQKFRGGRHDVSVLVGEEQIINKNTTDYHYYFGYDPSLAPTYIFSNLGLAQKTLDKQYITPKDNMLSLFARANYVLYGRYYLTATFRADASTKFARGHQWGCFPSGAIAWRMSDEKWMAPAQDVLSNLKWRLSYGSVGNNNVDLGYLFANYLFDNTANYMQDMNDVLIDGKSGGQLIAPNPNLKWETTVTRDLGLDYGFWNERLSGSIDLYWNTTRDLILKYRLATGGYGYQFRNIGSTDNKGVEFSIRGVILDRHSKDLSYGLTIDANIAHNKNTVVDLGGMNDYQVSAECFSTYYTQGYEFYLTPGSAIGDIYGYETDGIYTTADFTRYNTTEQRWETEDGVVATKLGQAYPGMTKLKSDSLVKLGNSLPVVSGGFNLSWFVGGEKWGRIDMTANFTYSVGNSVVNMTALDFSTINSSTKNRNLLSTYGYANRYSLFDTDGNMIGHSLLSGSMVSGEQYERLAAAIEEANSGKTTANPYSQYTVLTDKYVEDGSFLRLAAINIGYSLPERWISKAHMTQARVFFTASNLFVATKYSGADPEVDTRSGINPLAIGVDYATFPRSRSFNFGLNISF